MASETDICNRALQKMGAGRITSINEDSPDARECKRAFSIVRDAELRRHVWGFATRRQTLAASTTAPAFGYSYAFPLPSDYLRLHPDAQVTDWSIEYVAGVGRCILTDDGESLNVRYIARITDTAQYDALFVEAFAAKLALECHAKITQSTLKERQALEDYKMAITDAKAVNAIEKVSAEPPEDAWITARL